MLKLMDPYLFSENEEMLKEAIIINSWMHSMLHFFSEKLNHH